ncbi:MAG: tryptophan-rich sensory protein [Lachnospiraceae bacterium]|nr:tryptophan-rich sensory protein [Lachnospiraceae bacterium]
MKKTNKSELIIAILIPLAVGSLSALLSGNKTAFSLLTKPPISPPAWVFPVVWTVLYILMGISYYMIYVSGDKRKSMALKLYVVQLFFNFFWSIFFFGFLHLLFAFFWLIALIVLVGIMIRQFIRIRPLAGYLQIPYLLWCLFAAVLNYMFYLYN